MHLVLQSIRAGKYFPHDEMFIVDNLFWKKCREKNMSGYSGLFKKSFELLECSYRVAHNEQGLALLGDLKNVRPETQPNTNTKVEVNNQNSNRITSTETAADSELQPMFQRPASITYPGALRSVPKNNGGEQMLNHFVSGF